jgi:alkylhydroperoxidase family enzyme
VVIADPRAIGSHWPQPRTRALAELTITVTEAPAKLTRAHYNRAIDAGLSDDDILQAVLLSAFFGHLNRIADAVAVPLDYQVRHQPPETDPTVPALPAATNAVVGKHLIDVAKRPATAAALADWRTYIFTRDAPLTRRQRTLIARWVALWLGDGGISTPNDLTVNPIDDALRALAEQVTLAPWQLSNASFTALRAVGFDDAALFDVCATASSAGMFSRIEVALIALGH